MSAPNGHDKPNSPRRPRDPAQITHYDYADVILEQVMRERKETNSSTSSGDSAEFQEGGLEGSQGRPPTEDEASDKDANIPDNAILQQDNLGQQQQQAAGSGSGAKAGQGDDNDDKSAKQVAAEGEQGGTVPAGNPGPTARLNMAGIRGVPDSVMRELAQQAVVSSMTVERGPVVQRPPLPPIRPSVLPPALLPREPSPTSAWKPSSQRRASLGQDYTPISTPLIAPRGRLFPPLVPDLPKDEGSPSSTFSGQAAAASIASTAAASIASTAAASITSTAAMSTASTAAILTASTAAVSTASTMASATASTVAASMSIEGSMVGGSSSTVSVTQQSVTSLFQPRSSPSAPSVARMRPFSVAASPVTQAGQSEGTPSSALGMRRFDSASGSVRCGGAPGGNRGPRARRSFPFSAVDSSTFSPFTSLRAQQLLGPRLAPELQKNLFNEAVMQQSQTAEESGDNSALSASLLAAGRQVIGTEADESATHPPSVSQVSEQSSLVSISARSSTATQKTSTVTLSMLAAQSSTSIQGLVPTQSQEVSPAANTDKSPPSSSHDLSSCQFGAGAAQRGSYHATSRASISPGTPLLPMEETSIWSTGFTSGTFTVSPLANQENISPRDQHGSDGSASPEANSETTLQCQSELQGPILSLLPNLSDSDLPSPRLVLREIQSSSNGHSQPHYPSENNPSSLSSSSPPTERCSSSDGYPRSGTTTSNSDNYYQTPGQVQRRTMLSRRRYAAGSMVDRQHRANRMRERRLRTQEEVGEGPPSGELTRHVEGAETTDLFQRMHIPPTPKRAAPSSDFPSSSPRETSSSGGSTLRKTRYSQPTMRSSEKTASSRGSTRSSSHPLFHSTMIEDPTGDSNAVGGGSGTDPGSTYTWSLDENGDGEHVDLKESYLRSCKRPRRRFTPSKRFPPNPLSSGSPSQRRQHKSRSPRHSPLEDYRKARRRTKTRRELSYTPTAAAHHDSGDGGLRGLELSFSSSDERSRPTKAQGLPRTSTRLGLLPAASVEEELSFSSMMSGIQPLNSSSLETSPPVPKRMPVPGMSSTSEDMASTHAQAGSSLPPMLSFSQESPWSFSPDTAHSSGLFAPYNSYNSPASVMSHCGSTTPSGSPPFEEEEDETLQMSKRDSAPRHGSASHRRSPASRRSPAGHHGSAGRLRSARHRRSGSAGRSGIRGSRGTPGGHDGGVFKVPARPVGSARRRQAGNQLRMMAANPMRYDDEDDVSVLPPVGQRRVAIPVTASTSAGTKFQDKKAILKRLKDFSKSLHKKNRDSGSDSIRTLANL